MGPFRRVAWWCWYEGRHFAGYQAQAGLRTVQGALLQAFAAAGLERNPVVASRTDAGVSARMNVLSARLRSGVELDRATHAVQAALPGDVGLHLPRFVPEAFSAAWSATAKEYRYGPIDPAGLDVEGLRAAAALVPGTRDFRVFHHKTSSAQPRTVLAVELLGGAGGLTLRVVGTAFGRYMVRMLSGALLGVARGAVTVEALRAGLEQARPFGCPVAPAAPLTLWDVAYPPALDPFPAEERQRFAWPRSTGAG